MNDTELIDLGFSGKPFTWNNRRLDLENIQEPLGRGIANDQWPLLFPQASVSHLTALSSDHTPLLLHNNPPRNYLPNADS